MKNITYLLLCCLLFICSSLHAQQTDIKGIVSDSSGEPLPGVSISIKGTTFGTITNMDGQFTIRAKKGNTLIFSFIGYQTVEQKATDTPMKVTLQESSVQVDEVVVTALGIKKEKKALAYSVTEVKSEELNRVKVSNIANSLVGKVAGVNVVKPASGVMGSSRITIRGNGSLNGSNQPLYVIDGVPMNNGNYGQAGEWGGFDAGDGISSINSEDIESMSVLKGGTAAALYGSRAANGAIVITTKKGTAGKVRVEYNMSYTKDSPILKNNDLQWEYGCGANGMNPDQLAIATGAGYGMTPEQAISQLAPTLAKQMSVMSFGSKMDGSNVTQYDGISRPYSPTARNNFKDFYDNAWSVTNNIAVSGGNEKIQFRVGAGDQRFHDMQPNSKLERNNITLNLTSRMNEHFSLKANIMYVRERAKNRPNLGDITSNANASLWQLAPNYSLSDMKITNDDGTEYEVNAQGYVINPLFVVYKNSQKDAKDRIIGSVEVQYNFTPNWYLRGRAGGDMINRRAENVTPWGTARGAVKEGNISNSAEYHGEFNTEAIAGYTNSFKDGLVSVDAFIGWNTMASWSDATSSYGDQFVVPGFNTINNTKTKSGGHSTSESYINSLFGQAEMSYKSMIYLTLTGRNDWFSALSYKGKTSPNHIFYPSVGLGFILSEAIQMPSWFPYLKLRGSWAQSGGAVGAYQLGLTYSYADAYRKYPVGSIDNGTIPNLNLKPLTSISYEGGFEARFFNNRFGIDFTYYVRNTKDDIVNAGISTASGYGNVKINAGKVNNHGIELLLTGTPILSSHFRWDTSFNFAYNKSEIKRITDDVTEFELAKSRTGHDSDNCGPAWIYQQVGQPYGIIRGVTFKRNDKGEIMYENGLPMKGEIEKLGESVHPYTLGFSNSFECHGFTLSFLLDGKFGGKMYSQTNAHMIMFGRHADTLPGREEGIIAQGVKEDGVTPNDVKVTAMKYYMALSGITENCIYDASFIKLRELSFGYNFPTKWIRKIGLSALSLSVVGRNLWNIYDKVPLVDPESSFNIDNGQGFESYGLPASRSIGFNLNVKF
ncbi:SusC/RagA family TonB-linked outer membrane protein [Bacteroides caccae]|uniref:SusC/RagA family TonB-linked outer membrane protein n=1 Tax=Bacteroides caccae TaxID=47678 RepID=UPI0020B6E3B2|nr:SusC/RagA family TonB-linked outer membrane protein [Bacteroides caccae]